MAESEFYIEALKKSVLIIRDEDSNLIDSAWLVDDLAKAKQIVSDCDGKWYGEDNDEVEALHRQYGNIFNYVFYCLDEAGYANISFEKIDL